MMGLLRLLLTGNGIFAAIAAGLVAFGAWTWAFAKKHQAVGEQRAVAKIEKATTNAIAKGKRAAAASAAPGVRGVRDPSTRND